MKKVTLLSALLFTAFCLPLAAEKGHKGHDHGHDHDHGHAHGKEAHAKKQAGPNSGRVITSVEPHLEIVIKEDRFLQIIALDNDNQPAAIDQQSVKVYGGSRAKPTRMTFVKKDDVLVSDKAIPEGNGIPVILHIKTDPEAKTVIEKFFFNLNDCPGCEYKEYACVCDH